MTQKTSQKFQSECGRAFCIVENDMPIGVFHDFLMQLKGAMVERMVAAHKQHVEELEAQKELPEHESEEKVDKPEGE